MHDKRLKILAMYATDQIRRWRRFGLGSCLCGLLCLTVPVLALAQTETPAPAKKPPAASTTDNTKAKHPTSTHATTKHASSHGSTHAASHTSSSSQKSKSVHGKKGPRQVAKKRGQQAIDSDRAREIQTALIREHYMEGEPTGAWDAATQAAMQRFQADQGWQSKQIPDSRALIKLGLGPSKDHLLNPENAMTTAPADPKAASKPAPATDNIPQQ